jgi:uncharacterized protein (UPF0335 family)
MALTTLSTEDRDRLKTVIDQCARMKLDIKDQNDSIKDLVANAAEAANIDKKVLMDAIKFEFKALTSENGKGTIEDTKEVLNDVEELLHVVLGK